MSNESVRRHAGRAVQGAVIAVLFAALPPSGPTTLLAQVGFDPVHSPFRDLAARQELSFMIGHFGGNTAKAGVGARPATSMGLRFRSRLTGPLDFVLRGNYIASQRLVLDPTQADSVRHKGVIDYGVIEADLGIALTLTGPKTWHGLAPWVGIGLGITAPSSSRTDPGGFKPGIGFSFVPSAGTSITFSRQLGLQLELRDNTIRYGWPLAYYQPRDHSGNVVSGTGVWVLDPAKDRDKQTTHNFTLSAGLSYHFNF